MNVITVSLSRVLQARNATPSESGKGVLLLVSVSKAKPDFSRIVLTYISCLPPYRVILLCQHGSKCAMSPSVEVQHWGIERRVETLPTPTVESTSPNLEAILSLETEALCTASREN